MLAKHVNIFLYLVTNFEIALENGGNIDYVGKCHNVKLKMGK